MAIAAITFDGAGTLFEPAEAVGATYARLAARHGIHARAAELEEAFRAAFAAAPPLAFPGASPTRLADHERAWWYAVVWRVFGPRAADPAFEACFTALFAHYGRGEAWRLFPEARDALSRLRARGIRLAVVSNFDGRLPGVLAGLGLTPLLACTTYSTRAGAAKPDPAIFGQTVAALGVSPDETVHVGDSVVADVSGARAAGLRAVLVDRARRRPALPAGVPIITSLVELDTLQP